MVNLIFPQIEFLIVSLLSVDGNLRLCFTTESTPLKNAGQAEITEFYLFFQVLCALCVLCGEILLTTPKLGTIEFLIC